MNKIQIYTFSYLCYTAIHCLRTSYSYSKKYIADSIGIVDALMLGFLGIGHFLHAVKPIKKPVYSLYIGMILCGLNYLLIPLFMKLPLKQGNMVILSILMCSNGFLQSYTWPNLLMIIHSQFDPDKYSVLLGFWATNANAGNILGYAIPLFLVAIGCIQCWQMLLIIAAVYALINGFIIGVRFKQLPLEVVSKIMQSSFMNQKKKHFKSSLIRHQSQDLDIKKKLMENQVKSVQFIDHQSQKSQINDQSKKEKQIINQGKSAQTKLKVTEVFKDPIISLLTITFALAKSVIYGIMLWLPLYFQQRNDLKEYASQIPITYDIAAIFGSVFLGYLFRKIINKGTLMIPFMSALFVCFFLLRFNENLSVFWYFFIIAIVGFTLGGLFNTLSGLVIMELTNAIPDNMKTSSLGFYSALTMAVGNITTAVTQILIGFVIGKTHQQGIFLVFMIYAAICLICLIFIAIITMRKLKGIDIDQHLPKQEVNEKQQQQKGIEQKKSEEQKEQIQSH